MFALGGGFICIIYSRTCMFEGIFNVPTYIRHPTCGATYVYESTPYLIGQSSLCLVQGCIFVAIAFNKELSLA